MLHTSLPGPQVLIPALPVPLWCEIIVPQSCAWPLGPGCAQGVGQRGVGLTQRQDIHPWWGGGGGGDGPGLDISPMDNPGCCAVGSESFHIGWSQPGLFKVVTLGVKDIISLIMGNWFQELGESYSEKLYSVWTDVLVINWFWGQGPNNATRIWSGILGRFLPMWWEFLAGVKGVIGAPPLGGVLVKRWGRAGSKDIKWKGGVSDC
ncbi:hypothetical protein F5146DRAFT_1004040 [Armillaria mellea]|nr:hypothetical protein F5146DRAFT_1004040 [Armillaria mellea]